MVKNEFSYLLGHMHGAMMVMSCWFKIPPYEFDLQYILHYQWICSCCLFWGIPKDLEEYVMIFSKLCQRLVIIKLEKKMKNFRFWLKIKMGVPIADVPGDLHNEELLIAHPLSA